MSNEKSWGKILVSLLVALLSGGGLGGYFAHRYYAEKISELSETKGRIEVKLKNGHQKHDDLQAQLDEKQLELDKKQLELEKWKKDFQEVYQKWERCIDPGGTIFPIPDNAAHQKQFRRGDRIEIAFTSFSFYCKLIRVTTDGPVFEIFKCQNYRVKNGLKSPADGENSFLVTKVNSLQLVYTSQSCENGDLLSDSESCEELTIQLENFNTDEQTAEIKCQRKFLNF